MHCPNILSPQWKNLVEKIGETNAWREFFKYGTIPNAENYDVDIDSNVSFTLKSIKILFSNKAEQIFAKGQKANWDLNKILTELQIPK